MPFMTLFLWCWKPEPDFVCVMICIQENTEKNRHVHSLVSIEFYGYSL